MSSKVYLFRVFVRMWHWTQAILIIGLLTTGFEVHGAFGLLGFERAVDFHTIAAWSLMGLWAFAAFWHATTGEWRQYVPTLDRMGVVARYYSVGIFRGEPHPFRPTPRQKHNPLQRLTYLVVLIGVGSTTLVSGLLYLFQSSWAAWGLGPYLSLGWVAFFHTAAAFGMLIFLISHLYLITAGATLGAHLKAMVTGWEQAH